MLKKTNNILFGFLSSIVGSVLLLILTIYITRTVTVDAYGEAKYVLNVASIALVLFMMGRENILVISYQREGKKIILEEVFLTISFLFFLSIVVSCVFVNLEVNYTYYLGLLMVPLWGAFNISNAALRAVNKVNESFFISNVIQRLLRFTIVIGCVFLYPNAFGILLGYVVSQLALVIISLYVIKPNITSKKNEVSPKRYFNKFSESIIFGLTALTSVLMIHLDSIMLGQLSDISNVALYDIAYSLSIFTFYPLLALVKSTETNALELSNPERFAQYNKNVNVSVLLSSVMSIFFIVYGKQVLLIFGNEYVDIYYAMLILTCGFTIITAFGVPTEYLLWNKKRKTVIFISSIAIGLNVILNIILIPIIGGEGAAIASISSLVFLKSISSYVVKSKFKVVLGLPLLKVLIYLITFLVCYKLSEIISLKEFVIYKDIVFKLPIIICIIIVITLVNMRLIRELINEYKK
ncbi:oligosaccharide flippase family protein [Vibrio crassostreae]|uniref:oligosaccharide flippase family protein n=1 Tax=Vibrio crassostreae TaxID=246167 RepID=UPI001B303F84|nr:oligosaccharide flippase family protein [Vibrio crassostreae]